MQLKELKKSLWGYDKESVYQYIAALEAEITERFAEKNNRTEQELADARVQISGLEKALKAMQEENRELKEKQSSVAKVLEETQEYARQMKAETDRREKDARGEIETVVLKQKKEVEIYGKKLRQFRYLFYSFFQELDREVENLEEKLTQVQADEPDINLSLFSRKEKKHEEKNCG